MGLLVHRNRNPRGDVEQHGMGEPERKGELPTCHLSPISDTDDVQFLLEPVRHAGDGVGDQAACQSVKLRQSAIIPLQLGLQLPVVHLEDDPRRQGLTQRPLRALDLDRIREDLHGDSARDRNRFLAHSRHDVTPTRRCTTLRRRHRPSRPRAQSSRPARSSECWSQARPGPVAHCPDRSRHVAPVG